MKPLVQWIVAFSLAAGLILCAEVFWRYRNHVPVVTDSGNLWSLERSRIYQPNTIVLIGASRTQLDIDQRRIGERYPGFNIVNLAVDGRAATRILQDLAEDDQFRGRIIADVLPHWLTAESLNETGAYVFHYHHVFKKSLILWIDTLITAKQQEYFVSKQANLRPLRVLQELQIHHGLPRPFYVRMWADRAREADYSLFPEARELRTAVISRDEERGLVADHSAFAAFSSGPVRQWIERLRDRGGNVIFIRLPTQGIQLLSEERMAPRATFWDQMTMRTGAEAVYVSDFTTPVWLPDDSHMDGKDKRAFTDELIDVLKRKNFLP